MAHRLRGQADREIGQQCQRSHAENEKQRHHHPSRQLSGAGRHRHILARQEDVRTVAALRPRSLAPPRPSASARDGTRRACRVAWGRRSSRARARQVSNSSSTARWMTNLAPTRRAQTAPSPGHRPCPSPSQQPACRCSADGGTVRLTRIAGASVDPRGSFASHLHCRRRGSLSQTAALGEMEMPRGYPDGRDCASLRR